MMEGIPEVEQILMWCIDFLIVIIVYFIPQNYKRTGPKDFLYMCKTVCEGLNNLSDVTYWKCYN
jgi:hypothetical protein